MWMKEPSRGDSTAYHSPADVMITITDSAGKTIKTLYEGQQGQGSHLISWDGTDNAGNAVEDGSYKYTVMANAGYGFSEVPATVTGRVEGVTYNNNRAYLVVQGVLVDPDSIISVMDNPNAAGGESEDTVLSYLGKSISSNSPLVLVADGAVSGEELSFELDTPEDVTINIYDAFDELVRTITVPASDTQGGANSIEWDGVSDSGYGAPDGLYYYTAKTQIQGLPKQQYQ
jgi:flagellar basal-body rod modification protein FlgD